MYLNLLSSVGLKCFIIAALFDQINFSSFNEIFWLGLTKLFDICIVDTYLDSDDCHYL